MTENGKMIKNMELEPTIINNKMKNTLIMEKFNFLYIFPNYVHWLMGKWR